MKLFGKAFGENNSTYTAIARDADKEAEAYEADGDHERASKLRQQARQIRSEMKSYRHLPVTKKFTRGGTIKTYKNLKKFHAECSKSGSAFARDAMICDLKTIRCLADGSGMATIGVKKFAAGETFPMNESHVQNGTWRLHFASCKLMKERLKGRVDEIDAKLDGPKRKR